jgi:hypothetical protein
LITFEHLQVAITRSIQELGNLVTSCTENNEFLFCVSHQNLIIPNNHIAIATSTGLITQTQTQKLQDRNHIMKKKKKKMMMPKKSLELALRGFKVLVVACFRNPGIQELGF